MFGQSVFHYRGPRRTALSPKSRVQAHGAAINLERAFAGIGIDIGSTRVAKLDCVRLGSLASEKDYDTQSLVWLRMDFQFSVGILFQ